MHIPQNYFQKIHLLFASNTAPDVLFMNNLNLPIYASRLEDLTQYVDKKFFYPQAIVGMSYDDKIFGFPRDISNLVLYVNLDKINLPTKDWTIDDLLKLAKNSTVQRTWGSGCEDDIYWITPYLAYYGGGILNNDKKIIIE